MSTVLFSQTVHLIDNYMYGGLADAEFLRGGADRGPILYDVKGQAFRPFLHVTLQNAFTPHLLLLKTMRRGGGLCGRRAEKQANGDRSGCRQQKAAPGSRGGRRWKSYGMLGDGSLLQLGHPLQTVEGLIEGVVVFGEVQPDQVIHRLPEEAGPGHRAHAHLPGQVLAELQVALVAVFADVQQHVVGALRVVVDDVQVVQTLQKQLFFVGILGQKLRVVVVPKLQTGDDRFLQGGGAAYRQKVVDLLGPLDDVLRRDDVPQPPAGNGV